MKTTKKIAKMLQKGMFGMVLTLGMFAVSCASNLGVYDSSVPTDQQCTLIIDGTLQVKSFDGNEVSWKLGFWAMQMSGGKNSSVTIMIPAGAHDFSIKYVRLDGQYSSTTSIGDIPFNYEDFTAGHTYKMVPKIERNMVTIIVEDVT